jgi:hypothetical protein
MSNTQRAHVFQGACSLLSHRTGWRVLGAGFACYRVLSVRCESAHHCAAIAVHRHCLLVREQSQKRVWHQAPLLVTHACAIQRSSRPQLGIECTLQRLSLCIGGHVYSQGLAF